MELVKIENNEVVVSSREVAKNFVKQHKHVLDNIREILAAQNSATKLFHESEYENRGKKYPEYIMNRDGFSLLVMSFTGTKAFEWKIKYINAFNEMEAKLRENMTTPEITMARGLIAAQSIIEAKDKEIAILKPKAAFHDAVGASKDSIPVGDMAKLLRQNGILIGRNRFFEWLRENDFVIKGTASVNMPTQRAVESGLLRIKESVVNRSNGKPQIFKVTQVTPKGQQYFIQRMLKGGLTNA